MLRHIGNNYVFVYSKTQKTPLHPPHSHIQALLGLIYFSFTFSNSQHSILGHEEKMHERVSADESEKSSDKISSFSGSNKHQSSAGE